MRGRRQRKTPLKSGALISQNCRKALLSCGRGIVAPIIRLWGAFGRCSLGLWLAWFTGAPAALWLWCILRRLHETAFTRRLVRLIRVYKDQIRLFPFSGGRGGGRCLFPLALAFGALSILTLAAFLLLALFFLTQGFLLFLSLAQETQIMFGVLLKVFSRHAVIGELRITRELIVFVDDLLRRTTHLALWAGAVEHTIDDITD